MRWTRYHNSWLARNLVKELQDKSFVDFLKEPQALVKEAERILSEEFQREQDLEKEVQKMLNDLEQENSFDRQKMYSMLKKKLAEKKGMVL